MPYLHQLIQPKALFLIGRRLTTHEPRITFLNISRHPVLGWSRSMSVRAENHPQAPVSAKGAGQRVVNEKLSLSITSELPSAASVKPVQPAPETKTKPTVEEEASTKPSPPPLLILDLNGCLLYRQYQPGRPKAIHPRPHIQELFQYALGPPSDQGKHGQANHNQNWEVLIWSSAQSKNVDLMCKAINVSKRVQTPKRAHSNGLDDISNRLDSLNIHGRKAGDSEKAGPIPRHVLDIWNRSQLDLSSEDYSRKVSTTKDLRKIWDRLSWTDPESGKEFKWSAHNTVIVDDSPDKLSLQPDNLCMINEFSGDSDDKALLQLIDKLKSLRNATDIPEAIKKLNEEAKTS
ncbi:hypothetical protein Pst134EA_000141 [Puccinia striiformis f. sp. tritici]|uniref:Mitochondrial import inner membrane translocase subunit TIM50 n=2 Tax=Puccinia striiformis TaxID=27350 RepID=A0A0L0VB99_9BASI|nr:hypothetical protein Pst134EA_000141 [Puccinia striiformis f. sp. tritici]KAI9601611.1 hypothetical protein H4Q26_001442 [Puccinia striiformis f. sp. tritici PST-130]KNE96587.1 hypothetical protein PSTG_10146 [Puccinia striiformis f. sp. tritici PST-78]KAH9466263.1 hypothetical protein Pst134EB_001322 [Puccinia striiformis f. sp. tritici]KAH9473061.1 hypothetical protein Pst134EA_000141 [Puccinia striiformis f. sp. tritici]KAI9607542.1 hypothetical protein KEM48_001553 [Puccinia striiformis